MVIDTAVLRNIGLNFNEIKIYLALLELGETTTGPLTKKTEQSNAKVYETLARLQNKRLVTFIIKDNKKYFNALSPEQLLKIIEGKQTELDKNKTQIQNIIPQLNSYLGEKDTQQVTVYHGLQSWKNLVENMFEEVGTGGSYISIGSTFIKQSMGKEWYEYCQNKKKQMQIQSRNIWDNSIKTSKDLLSIYHGKSRIAPNGAIGSAGVWVYNNKVLELSYANNNYFAVLIQSKQVADSSKELCENIWKSGKKIPRFKIAK